MEEHPIQRLYQAATGSAWKTDIPWSMYLIVKEHTVSIKLSYASVKYHIMIIA